jgi:hypothetical protein
MNLTDFRSALVNINKVIEQELKEMDLETKSEVLNQLEDEIGDRIAELGPEE